jgi:hypothetical protein
MPHIDWGAAVSLDAALQPHGQQAVEDPAMVQRAAAAGMSGSGDSLPHLDRIQASFGPDHDLRNVQAHIGGAVQAASEQIGANAYAAGEHVAFRAPPDLHTTAHEAAHVVQQRAGVSLPGGVGQAGDTYEQHADAVADRVVRGESAEDLLLRQASPGEAPSRASGSNVQRDAPPTPHQQHQAPAAPRYRELLREYRRRHQEGRLNELQIAAVEDALRKAEEAIRAAEAVADQGSGTGRASTGALAFTGLLVADDASGVGLADDVVIPFALLAAGVLYLTSQALAASASELQAAQDRAAEAVQEAIRTIEDAMAKPVPRAIPVPRTKRKDKRAPLPIHWPHLGGKGLPLDARNPAYSIHVGRPLVRTNPLNRNLALVEQYKAAHPIESGQAVHHVTPLFLGGPDSLGNLTAVWISYHDTGHAALRYQPQLAMLGMPPDLYSHPPGTPYVVASIV